MLLAIDIGNTNIVTGLYRDGKSPIFWRFATRNSITEDEFASTLFSLMLAADITEKISMVAIASVSPQVNDVMNRFCEKWLSVQPRYLTYEAAQGLTVLYDPPTAVGADRLANAIAAKARFPLPAIVIDFGTATTFDAIGPSGEYVGGSILPGVEISMEALISRAAKLPKIELQPPASVVGRNTVESLQSGIVLGYAGAIDTLASKMKRELGTDSTVVATGGLSTLFGPLCEQVAHVDEFLTLEGIRIFAEG